jgi:hypothetical protein
VAVHARIRDFVVVVVRPVLLESSEPRDEPNGTGFDDTPEDPDDDDLDGPDDDDEPDEDEAAFA